MKRWGIFSLVIIIVFITYYIGSQQEISSQQEVSLRQVTLERNLSYLKELPEIAWVRFDRNTVIIGIDRVPSDIQSIAQAAAFHGNRAIDFGVHVWVVPASSTCGAFKNYYGMTTARHGKIEKPFGK